jgi:hypothetical protein
MLDRFAALKNTIFGVIFRVLGQLAYHLQKDVRGAIFNSAIHYQGVIRGLISRWRKKLLYGGF